MNRNKKKLRETRIKRILLYNAILFSLIFSVSITGYTSLSEMPVSTIEKPHKKTTREFCDAVNSRFQRFSWFKITCNPDRWEIFDYTSMGNPLFYQEFGFNNPDTSRPVNLMLCGVHGDEPIGIYQCFHMVREILFDNPELLTHFRLVIAPIVNPDGFFANTRYNANGIDPNRNLPTKDWDRSAYKNWGKYKKNPRKYPGKKSGSETESNFQTFLINKYRPDKIISLHAPLGFLDFDGPGDRKHHNLVRVEHRAKFLGLNIEANTNKFLKLVDFPFFPGSLGNYAGNERKIPTYTIEFATNDPFKGHEYWSKMRFAIIKALSFVVYDGKEKNVS